MSTAETNLLQPATTKSVPQLSDILSGSANEAKPVIGGGRAVLFSVIALLVGCGVTTWIARGKYERFTGYLQVRTHSITCDREVRFARILTPAGKPVVPGAPLFKLEDAELQARVQKQKQRVQNLTQEVEETQVKVQLAVDRERNAIEREIFDTMLIAMELEGQRYKNDLEQIVYEEVGPGFSRIVDKASNETILEKLPRPLVIPADQFTDDMVKNKARKKQLENVKETLLARIEYCNKHLSELKKKSSDLPEKVRRSMGLVRVQTDLENSKTELAALEQQQQSLTINSPGTGIVGVYRKTAGAHVQAHEEIVQILDEDQPHLLLQIPSSRIADFTAGAIVELRFPGGKTGHGKVTDLPPQTANAPGLNIDETQLAVQIVPAGLLWPRLPIGTMIEIRRSR